MLKNNLPPCYMAFDNEGAYFSYFGSEWDSIMVFLIVCQCFAWSLLVAMGLYLTFKTQTLRYLQACNLSAIFGMSTMIAMHLDNSSSILHWLMEIVSYAQLFLAVLLNTEFFKKFSTAKAVSRARKEISCAGCNHCFIWTQWIKFGA